MLKGIDAHLQVAFSVQLQLNPKMLSIFVVLHDMINIYR